MLKCRNIFSVFFLVIIVSFKFNVGFGQGRNVAIRNAGTPTGGSWSALTNGVYTYTPTSDNALIRDTSIINRLLGANPYTAGDVTLLTGTGTQAGNVTINSAAFIARNNNTGTYTFSIVATGNIVDSTAINFAASNSSGNNNNGINVNFKTVSGSISILGAITTSGGRNGNNNFGGNAGNVTLDAATTVVISGTGAITANGATAGNGGDNDGGSAGIIQIIGPTGVRITGTGTINSNYQVANQAGINGAPGTVIIKSNASTVTSGGGVNDGQTGCVINSYLGKLIKKGTGTLFINANDNYSGATIDSAGLIQLGAANRIKDSSDLILCGGDFSTGATTGFSETMNYLSVTSNARIYLGTTGAHNLTFSGITTLSPGKTLTIWNWSGTPGLSGTVGKVFIGSLQGSVSPSQLLQINFNGFPGTAMQLANGEIVPPPVPAITSSSTASTTYGTASSYTITATNTPSSFAATGMPTGMTLNSTTGVITVAANTSAGNYAITLTATNAYATSSSFTLNYTVNKATLSVTARNQTVTYGTAQSTVLTTASSQVPLYNGFVNGENSSVISGTVTSYSTTYTPTTNAGTAVATITPIISGLTAANYNFSASAGNISVNKASLNVTASAQSVTYGTAVSTVTSLGGYTITGFLNGQNASVVSGTVTYTTNYTSTTNAGSSGITITPVITGLTATNYTFTAVNGSITITKAQLTVTANNQSVNYGTPTATVLAAGSYIITGFANGETSAVITGTVSYTTNYTNTTSSATTGVIITPVVTGLSATNYYFATPVSGTITIISPTTTITVTGTSSYTYTGLAQGPSGYSVTGSTGGVTFSYTGTGGTTYGPSATKPTNAGTYQAVATVAADANYTSAVSAAFAFTISKVNVIITANNQTISYGTSQLTVLSAGSYTTAGFVNGETFSVVTGTPSYTTNYTSTTNAGTAGISITPVVSGLTATNYTFTVTNGSITIIASASSISISGASSFVYTGLAQGPSSATVSGSNGSITYSYSGTGSTSYGPTSSLPVNAGTYQVTAIVAANTNYNSASSTPFAFTINKVVLAYTAGNQSVQYGTSVVTVTGAGTSTIAGFVNSETSAVVSGSVTYTTNYTATSSPGTSGLVIAPVLSGLSAQNYSFNAINGTITVSRKVLTVTGAVASGKVYDGTTAVNISGGSLLGVVASDVVNLIQSGVFIDKNVSRISVSDTNAIAKAVVAQFAISGIDTSKYSLQQPTLTAKIYCRKITVTAAAFGKTYDGTVSCPIPPNITSGNIQTGDTALFIQRYATKNVGVNITLQPSGTISDGNSGLNYYCSFVDRNTGVITPAVITITAMGPQKTYGTALTTTISTTNFIVEDLPATDTILKVTLTPDAAGLSSTSAAGSVYLITPSAPLGTSATSFIESNYSITYVPYEGIVDQKTISIINAVTSDKIYDGTTAAPIAGGVLSGVINGDVVNLALTAVFNNKDVGINKPITSTSSISGAGAVNYILAQPVLVARNITQRPVSLFGTKIYDGNAVANVPPLALTNNVDGSNLVVTGTAIATSKNIGTWPISNAPSISRIQFKAGNTTTSVPTTFSVTLTNAPVNGNTLIAVFSTRSSTSTNTITSITQSGTLWQRAVQSSVSSNSSSTVEIWYASNVQNAGALITINQLSSNTSVVIAEYAGILLPSSLDVFASNATTTNSTTASTGTTLTTAMANELLIGGVGLTNSTSTLGTPTNGFNSFSNATSTNGTNNAKLYCLEKITSSIGVANTGGTLSATQASTGAIAAFKSYTPLSLSGAAVSNYTLTGLSGNLEITPGSAYKLKIDTIPIQTAGNTFDIVVKSCDAFGNTTVVSDSLPVELTMISGSDTLNGDLVGVIPRGESSVTFSGLTYLTAEDSISVKASDYTGLSTIISDTSNYFIVKPGLLSKFAVRDTFGGEIPSQRVNVSFAIRVYAEDAYGNTDTSFRGTALITSTGNLSLGGGLTPAFTNGILSSRSISISNSGNFTITATRSDGPETGTSNEFIVGQVYYSITNGNWESNNTWSNNVTGTTAASSYPKNSDIVYIRNTNVVTVAASTDSCQHVYFTGTAPRLIVNANNKLIIAQSIQLFSSGNSNVSASLESTGTINCKKIRIGSSEIISVANITTTLTSTITNLNVSDSFVLVGNNTSARRVNYLNTPYFNLNSGSLTIGGAVYSIGQRNSAAGFTTASGTTLTFSSSNPFYNLSSTDNRGTVSFALTYNLGSNQLFNSSSNQNIPAVYPSSLGRRSTLTYSTINYRRVGVSGGGSKTIVGGVISISDTLTIETNTTLKLDSLNRINSNTLRLKLNGGTLSTGTPLKGYAATFGTLDLKDNSIISLGQESHNLRFSSSSAVTWTSGKTLTIVNWLGIRGNTGVGGRIYFGTNAFGLTSTQLNQIKFFDGRDSFPAGLLANGELIPIGYLRYAVTNGNWNSTSTWSETSGGLPGASVPNIGDNVFIEKGYTVTVNGNAYCSNLVMGSNQITGSWAVGKVNIPTTSDTLTVYNEMLLNSYETGISATGTIYGNGTANVENLSCGLPFRISTANSQDTLNINVAKINVENDLTIYNNAQSSGFGAYPVINVNSPCSLSVHKIAMIQTGSTSNNNNKVIKFNAATGTYISLAGGTRPITATSNSVLKSTNIIFTLNRSTFNYNSYDSSQEIPFTLSNEDLNAGIQSNPTLTYGNLHINNNSIYGAKLVTAITSSNVTDTISIGNINTGSLFNVNSLAIGRGANDIMRLDSASTLNMGAAVLSWGGTGGKIDINGLFKTSNTNGFSGSTITSISTSNNPTVNLSAGSTIEYTSTGTQPVSLRTDYANLTLTGSAKTMPSGTVGIAKNLLVNSGARFDGATNNTIVNLGGDLTNDGLFSAGNGLFTFNGNSKKQSIKGIASTTFNNVAINNSFGVSLDGSYASDTLHPKINATLTFNNGKITTNNNTLILQITATISGAGAGKYVYGNLKKFIATNATTTTFEVGDSSVYAPIKLDYTGTISANTGAITAYTVRNDYASISGSGLNATKTVNRYWVLNNNTTIPGLTSYNATFNFVSGDLDAGVNTNNFVVRKYFAGIWDSTNAGSRTISSTQAIGLTGSSFGVYQIGESGGKPTFVNPSDTAVCSGANASFTATPTSTPYPTIKWQRSTDGVNWIDITANLDAGTIYSGFSTAVLTLTGTSTGLNAFKFRSVQSNINGTSFSNPATLTIRSAPSITTQPIATASVCSGTGVQKIYVKAAGFGLTYNWRKSGVALNNGGVISGQGTDTLYLTNPTSANNGNYDVIISGGCTPAVTSATVTISVKALPTILSVNSNYRCDTGVVYLSASPSSGASVQWYSLSSGGSSVATGVLFATPSLLATTTYYVQAINTTTSCISSSRTAVTATIRNLPISPIGRDSSRCGSGTVMISASQIGSTIEWYAQPSGGTPLSSGNSFTTPVINSTTTYYAFATDTYGCSSSQSVAVTAFVNSVPTSPAGVNGQNCGAGSVAISATAVSGNQIDWYSASSGGSLLQSNSSLFNTPSITTTTNYFALSRDPITGCVSSRTTVQAKINPIPVVPLAGNNSVCNPGSVVLTAIVQSGQTADWYSAASGGTLLASGTTAFTTPSINATTNYYAVARDILTGCVSSPRTLVQAIFNVGASTSNIGIISNAPANKICAGTSVIFNAIPSNPGTNPTYQWKINGQNVGTDTTNFIASGLTNNSVVTVTMTTHGGTCSTDTTVTSNNLIITIIPIPNAPIALNKSRCGAGPITLIATIGAAQTVDWYSSSLGGTLLAGDTTRYYIANLSATDTFYAQGKDTILGCLSTSRTRVIATINSKPDSVLAIIGDQLVCKYLNNEDSIAKYYVVTANGNTRNLKFKWILPVGVTFANTDTTRDTIRVKIDSRLSSRYGRGIIWAGIISDSGCYGGFSSIRLYKDNPNPIGSITILNGQTNICDYLNNNYVYKLSVVPGRNYYNYLWTVPVGVTKVDSIISVNPNSGLVDSVLLYVKFDSAFVNGTYISVNGISWCGNKSSSIRLYRYTPIAPDSIKYASVSDSLICPVGNQVIHKYWIDAVPNATSYEWELPSHVTLVGNPASIFSDTIRVKFDSLFTSSVIKVRTVSNCGTSSYKSITIRTNYPDMPGVISGPTNACLYTNPQQTVYYTIRKVTGAISYDWRLPTGVTLMSRPGLNSVNDTIIGIRFTNAFNPDSSNAISVRVKICNWSTFRSILINKSLPNAPTRIYIKGLNNICQMGPVDASGFVKDTFYIQRTTGANKYYWDSSILSPRTTIRSISALNDTVEIKFNKNDTNYNVIKVYASNGCGKSAVTSISMRKNWPTIARYVGQISANNICANRIYKYTLSQSVAYADSIIWTLPISTAQIIAGRGTRTITVLYPSNIPNIIGTISAKGMNACGVGQGSILAVNISPCSRIMNMNDSNAVDDALPITQHQTQEIKIYPLPSSTSFHVQVNTVLTEMIQFNVLDLQGRKLLSGSMKPGELKELGKELSPGYYLLQIQQAGIITTRKLLKL